MWERGAEGGSVALRWPASGLLVAGGLLGVGAGRAHTPSKAPGPYA